MDHREPSTRDEIVVAFAGLADEGLAFWAAMTPATFASAIGDAWSPADNIRHLVKSTAPVVQALRMPRLALRASFGLATEPSTTYGGLVERYRARLAGGADAGKFAPSPKDAPADASEWQRELLERCRQTLGDLVNVAGKWDDADLDKYQLPHPLIGKLTLREMLFFTLYHYEHHKANVVRRLAAD